MTTSLVWIILPAILAAVLIPVSRWERLSFILGTLAALLLALLAFILPINELIALKPFQIEFIDTFTVLGRQFVIGDPDRYLVALIYLSVAIWYGGELIAGVGRYFIPLGLGIAVLLVAAVAVHPFVFSPLLIEMAILLAIPLLAPPGRKSGRGILRMLTTMTLGIPFMLLAGWFLSSTANIPLSAEAALRANIALGLGFALLLGIFPFHTWIPMLVEDLHPYAAGFILFLLPLGVSFLGIDFLANHPDIQQSSQMALLMNYFGVGMVVIGGAGAAFQNHLGRLIGFEVIAQIGFSLIAAVIGFLGEPRGFSLGVYYGLIIPRGLSMALWALAVTVIARIKCNQASGMIDYANALRYWQIQGAGRRSPLAVLALILAYFSLAGFPLLAGFPFLYALMRQIEIMTTPLMAGAGLLGILGLIIGGLRALAVLVMGPEEEGWMFQEGTREKLLLILGSVGLLLLGIFPQWLSPLIQGMTSGW